MNAMDMQNGPNGFPNSRTFENYLSVLNFVNRTYGWEPGVIYYDRMNDRAREISYFIYSKYKIANTAQFRQKMSALSSLMSRTGFGKEHNIGHMVKNSDSLLSVANRAPESDVEDWETLRPKLAELGKEQSICGIIARIFSHGYALRVGEIFNTRLDEDDGVSNYLDLDGCTWLIRQQKNGKTKTFSVDPSLCASLRPCRKRSEWLLCNEDGYKYSQGSQRLPAHGWPLASNNDIRKSFETWNRNVAERSEEEKDRWHKILGHSKETVKTFYDQKMLAPKVDVVPHPEAERIKVDDPLAFSKRLLGL